MTRIVLVLCVSVFGLSVSATAATVTFTSSAAFEAAVGGSLVTETFESLALNSIIPDGTIVNGLTYVAFPAGTDGRIDNSFNRIGDQSLALARGGDSFFFPGESFTVAFPSPVTAVGLFFNIGASPSGSLGITTSAGSATNGPNYDFSTLYFVGLLSDTSFLSATFFGSASAGSGFNVDNLSYAPAAVPEPGSMVFFGAGLAAAALSRGRRRRMALLQR